MQQYLDLLHRILEEGKVKSHLFRGKGKLTTYLKQNGYDGK